MTQDATVTPAAECAIRELNVAAYLVCEGHQLLRLQPGDRAGLAEFIFAHDPTLDTDRQHYFARATTVDARTICEVLLDLKRQAVKITKEKSVPNETRK